MKRWLTGWLLFLLLCPGLARHARAETAVQLLYADAFAAYGQGFVLSTGTEILLWEPETDEAVPLERMPHPVQRVFYADAQGQLWSWRYADEIGAGEGYDAMQRLTVENGRLLVRETVPLPEGFHFRDGLWADEDTLIVYGEGENGQYQFASVDRRTQAATVCHVPYLSFVAGYRDGLFLAVRFQRSDAFFGTELVIVDPKTGAIQALFPFDQPPEAFAYSPQLDLAAWVISPYVCAVSPESGEEPTVRGYLPMNADVDRRGYLALNEAGWCALAYGSTFVCTSLDPDWARNSDHLRIAASVEDREETKLFRLANPDFPVETVLRGYFDLLPSEVSMSIRSGDTSHDIFMIRSFEQGYNAFLERGFALDLSDSRILSDWSEALLPAVREAVVREGRLRGVPVELGFYQSGLAYDAAMLGEFGLSPEDLPADLCSLMRQLTLWYRDGTLEDVRVLNYPDQRAALIELICTHYIDVASAGTNQVDFSAPLFRALMEAAEELLTVMERQGCLSDQLPALFDSVDLDRWVMDDLPTSFDGGFLPLTLGEGMEPRYMAYVTVAVINPLSQRRERALAYLEGVVNSLPAEQALYLRPDTAEPLERPDYAKDRQACLDEIADDEQALRLADGSDREALQAWADGVQARLNSIEAARWSLSPESIERYRTIEDQIVMESELTDRFTERKEYRSLIRQYIDGQLELDRLIGQLVSQADMMRLEDEAFSR